MRQKTLQNIQYSSFFFFFVLPSVLFFLAAGLLFLRRDYLPFALLFSLYLLLLVAAVLVLRRHIARTARSIAPILDTMTRYRAGDTDSACDPASCSIWEFRLIAENLNDMIRKINRHIETEYELKIEQKTAEYQALQAEVDPHFLYNILNLFITLNRIGEKKALEKAIIKLSHLFRYTCEHGSETTLQKEFAFLKDYLGLQQIRFGARLSFDCYLEAGLENFSIPKLLIQPLVENAVVHSLEPSELDVVIQFTAMTIETVNHWQFVVLSVSNTGLPCHPDRADKRVGLRNLEKRLAIYNPNAFLVVNGGEGKATRCHIIIPAAGMD